MNSIKSMNGREKNEDFKALSIGRRKNCLDMGKIGITYLGKSK